MKLAFYYHIAVAVREDKLYLPSYLGVFVDSLAQEVETLYLVMHSLTKDDVDECDYLLKQGNIKLINLGKKTPAWHRAIFHRKLLKQALKEIESCDAFIVRSPTPLAPYFHQYIHHPKLYFMIVGDYVEGADHLKQSTYRDRIIYAYLLYNDKLFSKRIKHTNVIVNSPALYQKYQSTTKTIDQIRTTTLSANDFFNREDTCQKEIVELLYTGRIDRAKGLFELIEATSSLIKNGINVRCNIVGWESDVNKPIENALLQLASELGINKSVCFHGRKSVGPELNEMYRMSDIYIIPSYHEGFPRTIWEAMANGMPVIATKVGGIPAYLTHLRDSLLIDSHSSDTIVSAVLDLVKDKQLRMKLIHNGLNLAKENTLEIQSKNIINIISNKL